MPYQQPMWCCQLCDMPYNSKLEAIQCEYAHNEVAFKESSMKPNGDIELRTIDKDGNTKTHRIYDPSND